jgi:hypothetical protein
MRRSDGEKCKLTGTREVEPAGFFKVFASMVTKIEKELR